MNNLMVTLLFLVGISAAQAKDLIIYDETNPCSTFTTEIGKQVRKNFAPRYLTACEYLGQSNGQYHFNVWLSDRTQQIVSIGSSNE